MTDWPTLPAHIILMFYTMVGILTLSIVSSRHSFQCV